MKDPEDELLFERRIRVTGSIEHASAQRAIMQLLYLQSRDAQAPVTIVVNSPGGVLDDCFALYDVMRYVTLPVHTRCTGMVSGGAVLVFAAGTRGCRTADERAFFQLVPTKADAGTSDPGATARCDALVVGALARCCDAAEGELMQWLKGSRCLTAVEAAALGIVDYVEGGGTS